MSLILTALNSGANAGIVTGCLMRVALGAEDLVYETPCVIDANGKTTSRYRQAKVQRLNITIIPSGNITSRAGTLFASLESCTPDQLADDYSVRAIETTTLQELQQQPGVIMASAVNPLKLSWRPKRSETSGDWQRFGSQKETGTGTYGVGGPPIVYLTLGYSDLSSNSEDLTAQYAMTEATFEVVIRSRVLLRQGETSVFVRKDPVFMMDPTKTIVTGFKDKVLLDDVVLQPDGLFTWTLDPSSPPSPFEEVKNPMEH